MEMLFIASDLKGLLEAWGQLGQVGRGGGRR